MKKKQSKGRRNKPRIKLYFLLFFTFVVIPLLSLYVVYWYYIYDLPDLTKITGYEPPLINEIYSSDGRLIAEFAIQKRKLIPYEQIPDHVKEAFLAIEDKRFFHHGGVDVMRIIAALITNIKEGEIVQGASTITQQVTKNLVLSPEKSISRKIKEAILAYRMENNLSKEEIFYIYLNHIYLADGTYGVEAASNNYFGKSARDINIAEAAFLAGLPKRPEYYSPRKHFNRAIRRQRLVLKMMEEDDFITKKQRQEAEAYKINIMPKGNMVIDVAPYFVELVRQHVEDMVGAKAFRKGGYKIFTTIDTDQSLAAQWALRRGILDIETRRGRNLVIKNLKNTDSINKFRLAQELDNIQEGKTYEAVLIGQSNVENLEAVYKAEVGVGNKRGIFHYAVSSPLGSAVKGLKSDLSDNFAPINGYGRISLIPFKLTVGDVIKVKVNDSENGVFQVSFDATPKVQGALMAMDVSGNVTALVGGYNFLDSQFNRVTQALRQPGSAFKPFVYAAAIAKGYTETSVVYDMPVAIKDWAPKNYDGEYLGPMILRNAIAKSRNMATVRILLDISARRVVEYAKRFGFTSHLYPYPSLALGGSDVTLLELVNAYNVFASGGKLVEPRLILRVYDRNGRMIEDNVSWKLLSNDEVEREDREQKRMRILEKIAKSIGGTFRNRSDDDEDYLKEEDIANKNFSNKDEVSTYLSPQDFLKGLRSKSISLSTSNPGNQVISPETAFIVTDLLEAVINEGTGRRASDLNSIAPVAGKTGTTNDFTDAWFIGFSPRITAGVWVGKDSHTSLGKGEAGSKAALPIWKDFMEIVLNKFPGGEFEVPNGIRIAKTPYGNIPYTSDSLIRETVTDIRDSNNEYIESSYDGDTSKAEKTSEDEVNIDFLFRH
ncbi:MAG: transglycosylase domain-containing protein [Thermodesulfobacteriota bacterium]